MRLLCSIMILCMFSLAAQALEPVNPLGLCSRFIAEEDIQNCEKKLGKDNVDWYAATACSLQKDDEAFWKCWKLVKGKSFNPRKIEKCGEGYELSDQGRLECLKKALGKRAPSSVSVDSKEIFQPLKKQPVKTLPTK